MPNLRLGVRAALLMMRKRRLIRLNSQVRPFVDCHLVNSPSTTVNHNLHAAPISQISKQWHIDGVLIINVRVQCLNTIAHGAEDLIPDPRLLSVVRTLLPASPVVQIVVF